MFIQSKIALSLALVLATASQWLDDIHAPEV
jgi:hypothetical protein